MLFIYFSGFSVEVTQTGSQKALREEPTHVLFWSLHGIRLAQEDIHEISPEKETQRVSRIIK